MGENEPLDDRLKHWLAKTGLPLELRTAAAFKQAGFGVEHSSVYEDPQSDKGREIDVIAHTRDASGMLQFYVVVECKASPNPWIVLTNREEHPVTTLASLGLQSEAGNKALPLDTLTSRSDVGFILKAIYSGGYAMRQAFSSDADPAFTAAMSALKAARALVTKQFATPRFCFALPVVVVDAPIFECQLNGAGEPQLRKVECTEFLFTGYIPGRTSSVIRVVSRNALPFLSSTLWRLAEALKADMKPAIDRALAPRREAWAKAKKERDV